MPSDRSRTAPPARASIGNGEVVLRGEPITLTMRSQLAEAEHRSLSVLGHRVDVSMADGRRTLVVDTSSLPVGRHVLHTDGLTLRSGAATPGQDLEFVVVDAEAGIPDGPAVRHGARAGTGPRPVHTRLLRDHGARHVLSTSARRAAIGQAPLVQFEMTV
jgi:hypothetical protein